MKEYLKEKGIETGIHYPVPIHIWTFDPFGKGLSQYTFSGRCDEDPETAINNGARRVFYNCSYCGDDIPEDLRRFYEYVNTGKSNNELTGRIDNAVAKARKKEEWKSSYMKEMAVIMDAKEEGAAEERKNTEAERKRADAAESELARYKAAFGELT